MGREREGTREKSAKNGGVENLRILGGMSKREKVLLFGRQFYYFFFDPIWDKLYEKVPPKMRFLWLGIRGYGTFYFVFSTALFQQNAKKRKLTTKKNSVEDIRSLL